MQILVSVILIVVFGGVVWSMLAGTAEYVIRSSRGAVRFRGKFPVGRQAEVIEFFRREFADQGRITVSAVRLPQRGLRFVVRGRISEGDRQRIRNFLRTT
ncbi:MAG: hypothetical protein HY290_28720 [Planctomycetia bacterium]|nr:hypothetical protein [Planctomycetia bacterium]